MRTIQGAQGAKRIPPEQNKARFAPVTPGVGVWQAVMRSVQIARMGCGELLATKMG